MIYAAIIACEIGFWVVIVAGLAVRYLAKNRTVSVLLLASAPVIDLVLLIITGVHLRSGAEPSLAHILAAFYIGISLIFGHSMISWSDKRFAHRFSGGPKPEKVVGAAYAVQSWWETVKMAVAGAIAVGTMRALAWWVGGEHLAAAVAEADDLAVTLVAVFALWAASYTIWPRGK